MSVSLSGDDSRDKDPTLLNVSSLYPENVLTGDHSAVWGSLYDKERGIWGYACCQVTKRDQKCSKAVSVTLTKKVRRSDSDDSIDSGDHKLPMARWIRGDAPPELLLPREKFETAEAFIANFVRYVMEQWRRIMEGKPISGAEQPDEGEHNDMAVRMMFRSAEALKQTEDSLAFLVQRCEDPLAITRGRKKDAKLAETNRIAIDNSKGKRMRNSSTGRSDDVAPEMSVMERLERMTAHAFDRQYALANKEYVELTLGNKKWHNAYHGGEGKSNKGFKLHTVSMSAPNEFDADELVNNYVRAFRRVLLFCQFIRPNEDVSKHM